jgi:lycopene beta-cyclase
MPGERKLDILVIGAGPAATAIAAGLAKTGLRVQSLSPHPPETPWPNTYGIWRDELEPLGLTHLLGRQWSDCVSYAAGRQFRHERVYALFDNAKFQAHQLAACARGGVAWSLGSAAQIEHTATASTVVTQQGERIRAQLVIDASGHRAALLKRPASQQLAYQAAYGITGVFSAPPVAPGQMALMDFRSDHLTAEERRQPPTFLYAMDLGGGIHFVEETSLAHCPALGYDLLQQRLQRRLASRGISVQEVQHIEHCLFPMNLPLPFLDQRTAGYGAAASMVHPVSGYLMGAALKRVDALAQAVVHALQGADAAPARAAQAAWRSLWPGERVHRRLLYLFGLENLLRFDEAQTHNFFAAFFSLAPAYWGGYLSDTLTTPQILHAMWKVFAAAPAAVRRALLASIVSAPALVRPVVRH